MSTTTGVAVGAPFPEVTLPTLDGEAVSLSQFRGKRLVVFMWGSW
jgi:peroxiredoxin